MKRAQPPTAEPPAPETIPAPSPFSDADIDAEAARLFADVEAAIRQGDVRELASLLQQRAAFPLLRLGRLLSEVEADALLWQQRLDWTGRLPAGTERLADAFFLEARKRQMTVGTARSFFRKAVCPDTDAAPFAADEAHRLTHELREANARLTSAWERIVGEAGKIGLSVPEGLR